MSDIAVANLRISEIISIALRKLRSPQGSKVKVDDAAKIINEAGDNFRQLSRETIVNFSRQFTEQDRVILTQKQELTNAKKKFDSAMKVKRSVTELPNGNTKTRTMNPYSGTSVQYETRPDGTRVYHTVVKLDGTKYNTTFDEAGRIHKLDKSDANGKHTISYYDKDGKAIPSDPTKNVITTKDEKGRVIGKIFYNGDRQVIKYDELGNFKESATWNSENRLVETRERKDNFCKIRHCNPKSKLEDLTYIYDDGRKTKIILNNGDSQIVEHRFPKSYGEISKSKITIINESGGKNYAEVLQLRNGDKALILLSRYREPYSIKIQSITGEQKVLQKNEFSAWLKSIGHPLEAEADKKIPIYYWD